MSTTGAMSVAPATCGWAAKLVATTNAGTTARSPASTAHAARSAAIAGNVDISGLKASISTPGPSATTRSASITATIASSAGPPRRSPSHSERAREAPLTIATPTSRPASTPSNRMTGPSVQLTIGPGWFEGTPENSSPVVGWPTSGARPVHASSERRPMIATSPVACQPWFATRAATATGRSPNTAMAAVQAHRRQPSRSRSRFPRGLGRSVILWV